MNFRIKQWPRKKHRKREVQKFENLEDKRSFFGKIKSIIFYKSFILMAKVQIVGKALIVIINFYTSKI